MVYLNIWKETNIEECCIFVDDNANKSKFVNLEEDSERVWFSTIRKQLYARIITIWTSFRRFFFFFFFLSYDMRDYEFLTEEYSMRVN